MTHSCSQEADVKPTVTSPKPKLPNFTKIKRARSPSSTVDSSDAPPASSPAFALASRSVTWVKKEEAPALTDEELARQMQAEFEQRATVGRSTRNGGSAASAAKKRAPIKKSKKNKKAGSDDDDDGAVKKKKRKTSHTGFNKLHVLSDEMAEVCGAPVLSRPGVTKVSSYESTFCRQSRRDALLLTFLESFTAYRLFGSTSRPMTYKIPICVPTFSQMTS